jgi:hypothetical protein
MPREPTAGRFSHTNGVGRDRESGKSDIDDVLQSAVIHIGRSQPPVEPATGGIAGKGAQLASRCQPTRLRMSNVLVTSASGRVPNNASN